MPSKPHPAIARAKAIAKAKRPMVLVWHLQGLTNLLAQHTAEEIILAAKTVIFDRAMQSPNHTGAMLSERLYELETLAAATDRLLETEKSQFSDPSDSSC